MAGYGNQTGSYTQYGSNTTEYMPANSTNPSWPETSDQCGIITCVSSIPQRPSMLSGQQSQQNFTEPTPSVPLPCFPSTTSKALHLGESFGKRRKPAAAPRAQRKLAPKGTKAGPDTGLTQSLPGTSETKRSKRDCTFTCQNEPFNYRKTKISNVTDTTTNLASYSSAAKAHNSGPLLARGSHTPPDLSQAYHALCVVVEFCTQQPPGYLEHGEAVVLGVLKERLNAKRRATQHGEMGHGW